MIDKLFIKIDENIRKKELYIPFTIIVIFILFRSVLENIFSNTLASSVFAYLTSEYEKDIIIILTLCILGIYFYNKSKFNYRPPLLTFSILLTFSVIYLYYRFDHNWIFIPFKFYSQFYYGDSLLIFTLLYAIPFFIKGRENKSTNLVYDSFVEDIPIKNKEGDILGRINLVEIITKKIENTKPQGSFAIGINSMWGNGKSSFLKLIEENLKKEDKIFVFFNPWLSKNKYSISVDFFNSLRNEISKYSSEATKNINDYLYDVLGEDKNVFGKILKLITEPDKTKSLDYLFKVTNKTLSKIDKKIVIFIDDVDRLEYKEIIEVLKIIRNSANFSNTFFIVAYDKSYIVEALSKITSKNKHLFLEKIFQVEFPLPTFDRQVVRAYLYNQLKIRLPIKYHHKLTNILNIMGQNIYPSLDDCIITIRDATRFINTFIPLFIHLEDEVEFIDFFNSILFYIKYPELYTKLYKQYNDFFIEVT